MGYTKLFSSIVASSIWREDLPTKVVWITMLALKDDRHMVRGSVGGLAHIAGVTVKECEKAIKKFESPDTDSSNPANEGRKIEKCVGGWIILNGEVYRAQMSVEDRREYQRVYQAEYRKKKAETPAEVTLDAGDVNDLPDEAKQLRIAAAKDKIARAESLQEEVRRKYNPDFDPSKSKPGEVPNVSGVSLRAQIQKQVDEDPLTIQDKKAVKALKKNPTKFQSEYDLDHEEP